MQDRQLSKEMELRKIRMHILESVERHPRGLPVYLQTTFEIRRVLIYIELRRLISERVLMSEGNTKAKAYYIRDHVRAREILSRLRSVVAREQESITRAALWRRR